MSVSMQWNRASWVWPMELPRGFQALVKDVRLASGPGLDVEYMLRENMLSMPMSDCDKFLRILAVIELHGFDVRILDDGG